LPDAGHFDLREDFIFEVLLYFLLALMGVAYLDVVCYYLYVSKGDFGFQLMQDGDVVQLWLRFPGEAEFVLARVTVPADWYGVWHRFTGTYDGKVARLFVDGWPVAGAEKGRPLSPATFR
jgi:hypothetical protein